MAHGVHQFCEHILVIDRGGSEAAERFPGSASVTMLEIAQSGNLALLFRIGGP